MAESRNRRRVGGPSPEFYGLHSPEELLAPIGQKIRADCDMIGLISKDDPPVYISCSMAGGEVTNISQFLHHPKHSQTLYDRCREVGVPVIANIPDLKILPAENQPATLSDFFIQQLNAKN